MTDETKPNRKLFEPNYDRWLPPEEMLILLQAKSLRTRDKVEIICAFYAIEHHGEHPYPSEIASILSLHKSRIIQAMTELIAAGRAKRIHGKFALTLGHYSNPVVVELLRQLGIDNADL